MHVLFTNNTLASYAGSELYIYDLATELIRQGHRVSCFSTNLGAVAERLREKGCAVESDPWLLTDTPDVIHAHHRLETRLAAARFPLVPLVYVSHGVTHGLERPGQLGSSVTRFVAISDEVKRYMVAHDGIAPDLIDVVTNFVDVERFRPTRPPAAEPRTALVVSNHYGVGTTKATIERACELAGGLELQVIGSTTLSVWNVEDYIDRADVVITLGRGALQAMAMGRAVVIYDYRGGDGAVRPENFDLFAEYNFSGRARNLQFTPEQLAAEIRDYDPEAVEAVQRRVRTERSTANAAARLLAVYERSRDDFGRQWPPAEHLPKAMAALRDLAAFAKGQNEAGNRLAQLEFDLSTIVRPPDRESGEPAATPSLESLVQWVLAERDALRHEAACLNQAVESERARATAEQEQRLAMADLLTQKDDLLRRIANGRVMRLLNAASALAGRTSPDGR